MNYFFVKWPQEMNIVGLWILQVGSVEHSLLGGYICTGILNKELPVKRPSV